MAISRSSIPGLDSSVNLDLLPQLVGLVATVFSVSSVAAKCDRRLRTVAGMGQAVWAAHFWLLGAPTTAAICALTCSRQFSSLYTDRFDSRAQQGIALGYYGAFTLATVVTWQGWVSLLPWACSMLANYAYSSLAGTSMRKALRGCDTLAFVNAAVVGSIGALITCVAAIVLNTRTIVQLEGRFSTPWSELQRIVWRLRFAR